MIPGHVFMVDFTHDGVNGARGESRRLPPKCGFRPPVACDRVVVHDGLVSQVLLRKARRMVLSVMCVSLAVAAEGRVPVPEKNLGRSRAISRERDRPPGVSHVEPRVSHVEPRVSSRGPIYASRACLI